MHIWKRIGFKFTINIETIRICVNEGIWGVLLWYIRTHFFRIPLSVRNGKKINLGKRTKVIRRTFQNVSENRL